MSASPVFSSAARSRPFIFSPHSRKKTLTLTLKTAEILAHVAAIPKLAAVVPASRLEVRPAPEMVSSGIPQLDSLTGGLARGCLTEICGPASSGRTSVLLFALARATQHGEVCALVDSSDAFDPASAVAAGMVMSRLLWVRCGEARVVTGLRPVRAGQSPATTQSSAGFSRWQPRLGQMLKVTDLLLQSNGFGMIALDLGDIPVPSVRRIPLASWFRFRRAIEHTPTALLVLEQQPIAGSCSSVLVRVSAVRSQRSGKRPAHSELLHQFEITAELLRSRLERKPVQSTASFNSRAAWAG
jgi:recombination protein RecA